MKPISETALQSIARIIGPDGAAAKALADAESRRAHGELVFFFVDEESSSIIVAGVSDLPTSSVDNPVENSVTDQRQPHVERTDGSAVKERA